MNIPLVTLVLQSISSLAIAGGFIFAAIQLRQTRRAQHVSNFSRLVEMQMALRRLRVEHPELAGVHAHDIQDLPSDRDVQHYFLNLMQLSLFEIAWYAHRQGQLSDDYFASWQARIHALCAEPSFQAMLAKPGMKIMHDEFAAYVQDMARRNPAVR
ncbi:MAG: hypothetical protein J0L61_10260, partial [Planctomycetes bacterium]|nr:hypothetical protein [Planctomycetota bacterium]